MLKTTLEVGLCSPQILIYWLHSSDFRMHCINDKVDTFVMLGMMVTSTNVIREVGGRCQNTAGMVGQDRIDSVPGY